MKRCLPSLYVAAVVIICAPLSRGFVVDDSRSKPQRGLTPLHSHQRRDFLAGVVGITTCAILLPGREATAAPPSTAGVFSDKISVDDAKIRFRKAQKDLKYLLDNFEEISKGGNGDAVRNYLGTQGVTSNLFGIQKILNVLKEASDDIVEYTEAMEEFNAYYYQAEGAAYQSLFIEHSSAKGSPESLLATAKQDIVQMQKYMDQLAAQLSL